MAGLQTAAVQASAVPDSHITGRFDVGGHKLFMDCRGTGSPTVIYLHGAITEPDIDPHANGAKIQARLQDDFRTCLYDRRNVGHSETVDEPQRPDDVLRDLRSLLGEAGVEPPYVLLGASFGGMPAYLYANTYPDEVAGMVLLDAMWPDEFTLDHFLPPEERYKAFDKEDECCSLERISHWRVGKAAKRFIGKEPAIPVTYLASEQEPWNQLGDPEYDARVLDLQVAYVDRFSPGELIWVDAPHFMEPVIPDQIAEAVRDVIDLAEQRE